MNGTGTCSMLASALTYVLQNEGGYSNNPKDPGGQTNLGITKDLLEKWNEHASENSLPTFLTVQFLIPDNVGQIYDWAFWTPLRLSEVPEAIATAIMDIAVNEGGGQATTCAQKACGLMGADGVLGSKTIEALNHVDLHEWLFNFVGHVQDLYVGKVVAVVSKLEFLGGWLKRSRRLFLLAP